MITSILFNMFFSFLSSVTFAVLCNVPRKSLIPGGIVGMIGWLGYWGLHSAGSGVFISSFVCSLLLAFVGQIAATWFKMPLTVFYIPGFVPVVPGITFFEGFRGILLDEYVHSALVFLDVLYSAVGIASGLVIADIIFRFTVVPFLKKFSLKSTHKKSYKS